MEISVGLADETKTMLAKNGIKDEFSVVHVNARKQANIARD